MVTEKVKATGTVKELPAKVWQPAQRWLSFQSLLRLLVIENSTRNTARQQAHQESPPLLRRLAERGFSSEDSRVQARSRRRLRAVFDRNHTFRPSQDRGRDIGGNASWRGTIKRFTWMSELEGFLENATGLFEN